MTVRLRASATPRRLARELGDRPGAYTEPYQFIRKMACNFGWDWGPTLVTAGIWRPIGLQRWSGARLAGCGRWSPSTDGVGPRRRARRRRAAPDGRGAADGHRRRSAAASRLRALAAGRAARRVVRLEVPGRAAVVAARVRRAAAATTLDVTLPRDATRWTRGSGGSASAPSSWTPPTRRHALHPRRQRPPGLRQGRQLDPRRLLPAPGSPRAATPSGSPGGDAGVNLLRVWGGGLYESEDFYDLCDELGLLVWQDFPFACAAYPEEEPLASRGRGRGPREVARLMPHPSLVLWSGNNENIVGLRATGAGGSGSPGAPGARATTSTCCPRIVAELDPTRPYWPGSPYSGVAGPCTRNDPAHGTIHIWDVWNQRDYTAYRDYRPRFVAEFGFQGPPDVRDPARGRVSDEPLTARLARHAHHQKADRRQRQAGRAGSAPHLAAAGRTSTTGTTSPSSTRPGRSPLGVEHFRSLWPHCAGTIVWQLNDCWPVTSWAAVDGDGRRKPLWYALRRAYADRLLTVQAGDAAPWSTTPTSRGRAQLVVPGCGSTGELLAKERQLEVAAPRRWPRARCPPPSRRPATRRPSCSPCARASAGVRVVLRRGHRPRLPAAALRRAAPSRPRTATGHRHRPHPAARPGPVPGPARPGRRRSTTSWSPCCPARAPPSRAPAAAARPRALATHPVLRCVNDVIAAGGAPPRYRVAGGRAARARGRARPGRGGGAGAGRTRGPSLAMTAAPPAGGDRLARHTVPGTRTRHPRGPGRTTLEGHSAEAREIMKTFEELFAELSEKARTRPEGRGPWPSWTPGSMRSARRSSRKPPRAWMAAEHE